MRRLLLILAISLPTVLMAQDDILPSDTVLYNDTVCTDSIHVTLIMDDMPNAIIRQDSTIALLMMDKVIGRVRGEHIIDGFRVQIYASNRQQVAKNESLILQQRIKPL